MPSRVVLTGFLLLLHLGAALSQVAVETSGQVAFEAEVPTAKVARTIGGVTYDWAVLSGISGFSGAGFVEAMPNDDTVVTTAWTTGSPELRYSVTFANAGTYQVWLRGYADTADAASVYVGVNGVSPAAAQIDLPRAGAWAWGNGSGGVTVSVFIPSPGTHTLNIWMRDAGFCLDRVLLTRNPNSSPEFSADFWRRQSIYQIVTDRFFDGDPANNTLSPNYNPSVGNRAHGGDFKGVERKLDYIKSLGATAIWISPVLLNGTGDYHGYGATDFYRTDPRMGTMAELQSLVREAHRRGILVINDVVVNHGATWVDSGETGWPTFRYPPSGYTLRYNSGGRTYAAPFDNASLQAAFGNTGLANIFNNNGATQNWGDATQVELGELSSLDDFRTQSPYVRQRMREIWSWWIGQVGFDAYRIDTVKHVEMGFWDEWCPAIRTAAAAADKPNFFQFGEIYDGSDSKVGSYTGRKSGGNYKMDSAIDYPLYYQVGSVFATATGSTGQIENRYNNLNAANYDASALESLILNLDNHDQPRFLNAAGSTTARLEVALVFLYASRGIPSLYYGTEQDFNGGADPNNREDMFAGQFESGPSVGDNFNMTAPRFQLVAKLNNLRRLYPELATGTHHSLWANWSGPGLLAWARRLGGQESLVVLNTSTAAQTMAARPTIYPAGTVLVNLLNPAETLTVTTGTDGIPAITMPGTSAKIFTASARVRPLAPVVTALTPGHGAAGISPASQLTVTFSRAMNPASVQTAFSTQPASTGSFAWSAGNTVLTYTPTSNLAAGTLHTLRIEETAADDTGQRLTGAFESRFTTGAAASVARPSVNSSSVANLTDATADLTASITPNGAATTVQFEYGPTPAYGTTTPLQNAGAGNSSVVLTAPVGNLTPNTLYHYRVVATNSQGTTAGSDGTFTTPAVLPLVTTLPASFLTPATANLNGTVDPRGLPTTVFFEYGLQPNVLEQTTPTQEAGSAAGNQDRWVQVADLAADTTYFFRMVAVTTDGRVNGAVQSFRTAAVKPVFRATGVEELTSSSARLTAVVEGSGFASAAWFEWGTNSAYGSVTPAQLLAGLSGEEAISAPIEGLDAGLTYHFRGVATNANGVTYSPAATFVTGFPPPAITAPSAASTASNAVVRGLVNPNGRATTWWVEYGPGGTFSTNNRPQAADGAEGYANFSYSSPDNNGGSGFGAFSGYVTNSSNNRGRRVLVTASSAYGTANRMITGAKSFALTAGTSTTQGSQSGYRPFTVPRQAGTFAVALRCDVNNAKGFTGVNLKASRGTSFGDGELVSVGMTPASGNTAFLVTDASGQQVVDFGREMRGAIVDLNLDYDTLAGVYTLRLSKRADASSGPVERSVAGALKFSGSSVDAAGFGFLNANNSGASNQNLIFDDLRHAGALSVGAGTAAVEVAATLGPLAPGAAYTWRLVANSSSGLVYGPTGSFATGPDLTLQWSAAGELLRGGPGLLALNVVNEGGAATSGAVNVSFGVPPGLTLTGVSGAGWSWNPSTFTASRLEALPAGAAFPALQLEVGVAEDAPSRVAVSATVLGGGDLVAENNTASLEAVVRSAAGSLPWWREQFFGTSDNAGVAANDHSPAADGMPNLLKYALGLDPRVPVTAAERPSVEVVDGHLRLHFRRARNLDGVTLRVEALDGLPAEGLQPIWSSREAPWGGGTNAFEQVVVEDPVPVGEAVSGRRFLRLRVTQP